MCAMCMTLEVFFFIRFSHFLILTILVWFFGGESEWIDAVEVLTCDFVEFGFESLAGHGSWVLEFTQPLVGEQTQFTVGYDFFEGTLTTVGFGVLGTCEPAKEVRRFVIQRVGNEVMADARFAGCRVYGTFAIESERHEKMAVFSAFTHNWINFAFFAGRVILHP